MKAWKMCFLLPFAYSSLLLSLSVVGMMFVIGVGLITHSDKRERECVLKYMFIIIGSNNEDCSKS
jgi:hypothetical protein